MRKGWKPTYVDDETKMVGRLTVHDFGNFFNPNERNAYAQEGAMARRFGYGDAPESRRGFERALRKKEHAYEGGFAKGVKMRFNEELRSSASLRELPDKWRDDDA
jgi:hypothetical protein